MTIRIWPANYVDMSWVWQAIHVELQSSAQHQCCRSCTSSP